VRMDNKVGDNVPAQKKLAAIHEAMTKAIDQLRGFCITLTDEERKHLNHPRIGGEQRVEQIAALAQKYGVVIKNVPLDGMARDLALAKQIAPFVALFLEGLQLVTDTSLEARSEYWEAFLAYYGALGTASQHEPALAAEMKPIVEFMTTRPATKRQAPPAAT